MVRIFKVRSKKAGLPPGTLVHVGERKTEEVRITIIDYDESSLQEVEIKSLDQCIPFKETPRVTWIDVVGIHQIDLINKIGECFGIHPLILEDIVNTEHRPKLEDFDDYLFMVLKTICRCEKNGEILVEQISLIISQNFLISFRETEDNTFEPIKERIRMPKGRIRSKGTDYLAYAILDSIVDDYFVIMEAIGDELENLEEKLITNPTTEISQSIHNFKRDMIFLRKSIWPLREMISQLMRIESPIFEESTSIYLKDVYDHTIHIVDTIETFRDILSGMLDVYLSSISNRMNEVMKVLTIMATIFIPMTLVVGIYGMNFDYMPELRWHWGYPGVMLFMLIMGISMLYYFRKKRWL